MIYPGNFESKIGFDSIRKEVERRCISSLGTSYCAKMRMSANRADVELKLTQTNEFLMILQSKKDFPVSYFFDMRVHLKGLTAPGSFITSENLFDLRRSLSTVAGIVNFFAVSDGEASPYPCLSDLAHGMMPFRELVTEIDRIIDKFGNIKDSASPRLRELRQQIASATSSINGIMRRIIANGKKDGFLTTTQPPRFATVALCYPLHLCTSAKCAALCTMSRHRAKPYSLNLRK